MTAEVRWPPKVELLINGTWTEMTGDNAPPRQSVPIRSGRANESSRAQPASCSLQLKNKNGWLTPRNPVSPWYPYIRRGTQLRHSVKAGSPHLTLTGAAGSKASTPDDSTLDITSDWFIAVAVEPPVPVGDYLLVGKHSTTSNQRSVLLRLYNSDTNAIPCIGLAWSTDGTLANQREVLSNFETDTTFSHLPVPLWGPVTWAVWLDVNNGAGGVTGTFYSARTLDEILADPTGTQFAFHTMTTTSSVFSSTAPLEVGDLANGPGTAPYPGKIRRVQVRAGDSTGAIRANPDFTAQTVGATSFTDSASRPWTVSSATIDNWQTRIVGEIAQVAPTWVEGDIDGGRRVNIEASGMLRRLTQGAKALNSTLYRTTTSTTYASNVKAYWPFEDGREATQAASPIAGVLPATVGFLNFAGDDSLASSAPLVSAPGGTPVYWVAKVPAFTATDWAAEVLMKVPTVATSPSWTTLFGIHSTGTVKTWLFEANSTNIRIRGLDLTGADIFTDSGSASIAGSDWWALVIDVAQNGGNVDYQQYAFAVDHSGTSYSNTGSVAGTLGRIADVSYLDSTPADGFSFGHVTVTTGLGVGWRTGTGATPANGFDGERAADRIERLCAEEGVPVFTFGKPRETAQVGPQRPDTLVNLLQDAADADGGILCEQRHAVGLAYRTRTSLYNQDPIFDVTALSRGLINPFEPVLDDQRIRNDITVSRVGGSSARVIDQDSIDDEGTYSEAPPAYNVANDYQLDDIAGWQLHQGTWPELRYPSLPVKLRTEAYARALLDGYLQSGPGDIARLSDIPTHHPPGPVDQMIEHQADDIGSFEWKATVSGSPAGIWTVGVIEDSVLGRADTAGSELATSESALSVGASDTWSVATTNGDRWIDSATYGSMFPFDVETSTGEVVTVTAISGTSSPQTFTVTRGVNGITKAHPSGTSLSLAHPWVAAH